MSHELVELDFCCPECNCSQWQYDQDDGIYFCGRCDYVIGSNEDDPDYEDSGDCPGCGGCGFVLDERGIECDCPICSSPFEPNYGLF